MFEIHRTIVDVIQRRSFRRKPRAIFLGANSFFVHHQVQHALHQPQTVCISLASCRNEMKKLTVSGERCKVPRKLLIRITHYLKLALRARTRTKQLFQLHHRTTPWKWNSFELISDTNAITIRIVRIFRSNVTRVVLSLSILVSFEKWWNKFRERTRFL